MASLLDDTMKMAPRAKPKSGSNQAVKLLVALVLFLAAGVVFAWAQGWLGSSKDEVPQPSEQDLKTFQEQQKQHEILKKTGKVQDTGA